jgi:tRNA (uracil-5-)-methyltransferase
LTFASRFK